MYKSRKVLLLSFTCAALVLLTAATVRSFSQPAENSAQSPFFAEKTALSQNGVAADKNGYYLSVNEGYVSVFYNDDVIYTSDIKADSLRSIDREMLEAGIKAESYEEVLQMLEDFGS